MVDDLAAWSRREFLRLAGIAVGALALPAAGCSKPAVAPGPVDGGDPSRLPSLGGAPDTEEGRTIAAFVDTVVPGSHRDPRGAPGALDVGAAALFFDPELPAKKLVTLLVLILDGEAGNLGQKAFYELTPEERDQALATSAAAIPQMEFAIQLAKLAYLTSDGAARHLGYPGAGPGYVDDPDFSFGRPMAKEITRDGNLD